MGVADTGKLTAEGFRFGDMFFEWCQKKLEARIYENVHIVIMENTSELLSHIFFEQEPVFLSMNCKESLS